MAWRKDLYTCAGIRPCMYRYVCVHCAVLALKRKETYNALFIHDPRADHVLKIRFSIKNNEFMHLGRLRACSLLDRAAPVKVGSIWEVFRDERHGATQLYAFACCVKINQSITCCTRCLCIRAYALSLDLEQMHGINAPAMPNCCY